MKRIRVTVIAEYRLPHDWEIIENASYAILRGPNRILVPDFLWSDTSTGICVSPLSVRLSHWTAADHALNDWMEEHDQTSSL